MVKVSLSLIKELKWLIGFLGLTSATLLTHLDSCLDFLIKYDMHIFILCLFGYWFIFTAVNTKMVNLESEIREDIKTKEDNISLLVADMHRDQLRKDIKDLAVKLHNVEVIDKEDTIKYILDLRASQIKLGLNGYSQRALDSLESRIRI